MKADVRLRETGRWGRPEGYIDGFTLPGAKDHYAPDVRLEPTHVDLDLRLDIDERRLDGTAIFTLTARDDDARSLRLDGMGFDDVTVAGAASWRYDGTGIDVRLADAPDRGATARITVRWSVVDPPTGLLFGGPTPAEPSASRWAATDNETERARHWMPCVDAPAVRPTLTFAIRADETLTTLANGAYVGRETHGDGTATTRWQQDQPCPSYLTCVVVGDLVELDQGEVDGIPIRAWCLREYPTEHLERSFGRTADMLRWLQKRLGVPWPYAKYHQVALPGIGGAMENISLVTWDDRFVLDETLATEWTRLLDQINVHEMAHGWFGDLVVCRDYAHAWLKESWATYIEQVWFEENVSADEAAWEFWQSAQAYFGESDGAYARPICTRTFDHSWRMYDYHLYPGGACRLHALRNELGDAAFWDATQIWLERYSNQVVETDDFRRVLEERSGRSLARWFDQWIHSPGYPKLKVAFEHDEDARTGTFTIEQTQVDDTKGIGLFAFDLELAWGAPSALVTRTVRIDKARHVVVVPMPGAPDHVRIDPNTRSLFGLEFDPGFDRAVAQLTGARDVIGRIRAAHVLAKRGTPKAIDTIAAAWRDEAFHGVRVEMARALANAGSRRAVDALAQMIRGESDPLALEPTIRAAIGLRDPAVADAAEARLEAGELPWRAAAAAWQLLGGQRDDAPVDLLLEAARGDSYQGLVAAGAIAGLAAARQKTATRAIVRHLERDRLGRLPRVAAVRALGEVTPYTDKLGRRASQVEVLVDLLRHDSGEVARAAMQALGTAGETAAIGPLEAWANRVSAQDAVAARRAIASIRAAQGGRVADTKRADALETRVRELEKTVDGLLARVDALTESASRDEEST